MSGGTKPPRKRVSAVGERASVWRTCPGGDVAFSFLSLYGPDEEDDGDYIPFVEQALILYQARSYP